MEKETAMKIELMPHNHGNVQRAAQLRKQLARGGSFDTVAEIFRLLDDGSRVRIFWLLCHCEECVLNISALTEMSSPAVSHHLRLLKDSGLIESRRIGKEVYYKAADSSESHMLHEMIEGMMEIVCPDVRLKDVKDKR